MRKLFLSLFLLVMLVGCSTFTSPVTPKEQLSPNGEIPYLCVTEEGYQLILKEGYDKGYDACLERFKYKLCQPDLALCKPLWEDVEKFLKLDNSDMLARGDMGGCMDRAESLCNNATEQGIWTYVVIMNTASEYGHVIVAFPTQDRDLVFIEPNNDQVVSCKEGYDYSLNFPKGYWTSPYVITKIVIIK